MVVIDNPNRVRDRDAFAAGVIERRGAGDQREVRTGSERRGHPMPAGEAGAAQYGLVQTPLGPHPRYGARSHEKLRVGHVNIFGQGLLVDDALSSTAESDPRHRCDDHRVLKRGYLHTGPDSIRNLIVMGFPGPDLLQALRPQTSCPRRVEPTLASETLGC
jgi:hypothetical protein